MPGRCYWGVALFCDLVGAFEPCSLEVWLLATEAWADQPPASLRARLLGFAALRASVLGLMGLALAFAGSVLAGSSLLSGGVGATLLTLGAGELRKAARLAGESTT